MSPRILLVTTLRWPFAARLALAFRALGCEVQAWCPAGNPLEKVIGRAERHRATWLRPLPSLSAAIEAAAPHLAIPCDDGAALLLHALHAQPGMAASGRRTIERSLGRPASCALAATRAELMRVARHEGVRVPETMRVDGPRDLETWAERHGFPAVLKTDHSFGGLGVAIVRDAAQLREAFQAAMQPSLLRALADLVLRRNPAPLLRALSSAVPGVTVQRYVAGDTANRAVVSCQGEVLAGTSVMALRTQGATGPATVVRVVDDAEMAQASQRLVAALGLSGFCGLDFVIDDTGAAWLIEVNPRATPISHLALGPGQDLPAALCAQIRGESAIAGTVHRGQLVALFPAELQRDPRSPFLHTAYHDVPWDQPALVRDGMDLPWEERGIAARLRAALNPGRQAAVRATLAEVPRGSDTPAGAA